MKNILKLFSVILLTMLLNNCSEEIKIPYNLQCEFQYNPVGITNTNPRFSWKNPKNGKQTAYQIVVSSDKNFSKDSILWNSGVVNSSYHTYVPYEGPALLARQKYYWKAIVKLEENDVTIKSNAANWQMD